jgi:hypothetical protein
MLLLVFMLAFAVHLVKSATTFAAPTVSLPNSDWEITDSTAYPGFYSEHDPAGAGMLEYADKSNYDAIRIYYEKAQVTSYTASQLRTEAEDLFNEIDSSETRPLNASGTATFAGVLAGYAEGLDSTEVTFVTELVFIKGNYYFNIHAYYDATIQSEDNVEFIINSISVSGAETEGSPFIGSLTFWIIIIAVAIVIAVVVVVVVIKSKKKARLQQTPTQHDYPPPPP